MESNLTMCDYINHPSFMHIKETNGHYEILMKSIIKKDEVGKPYFFTLVGDKIDTYKYNIIFTKHDNNKSFIQTNKNNDISPNH